MLIVLSPAKRLDFESPSTREADGRPAMIAESRRLVRQLRGLTPADLARLMGISDSLASLNAARYQEWNTPFTPANAKPAVLAFAGDVYDGLQADSLDDAGLDWAQDHVRILSGLYGVLRPLDLIQAYRLEMGTRLPNERGPDLYGFWGQRIAKALRRAMADAGAKVLVNLASQEYFRSVDLAGWRAPIVQPVFEQWHGGKWKVISFDAKRARGSMTRFAIDRRLDDAQGLKDFDHDGYAFEPAASDERRWVFRRR
ncbi:MAG: peroxide stress protein YaaA [Pseudomonadota bacterium]|nr:peroxide stress protein YaaA [Pseudomonadota bacterium]